MDDLIIIGEDIGYCICIASTGATHFLSNLVAEETIGGANACTLTLRGRNGNFTRDNNC